MFGSGILDIAIGVAFVFLSVSLICTAIREAIEAVMKSRAMDLERGLRELLNDRQGTGLMTQLFDHPRINGLFSGEYNPKQLTQRNDASKKMSVKACQALPTYIPAAQFSGALIDTVLRNGFATPPPPLSIESLRSAASSLDNPRVQRAILSAIDLSNGDLDRTRAELEEWFNGAMDRVSGWYKRRTQFVLFAIGLFAAVLLNVDAITITRRLSEDEALRNAVVAMADEAVKQKDVGDHGQDAAKSVTKAKEDIDKLRAQLTHIGLPIGWEDGKPAPQCLTNPNPRGTGCSVGFGMWVQTLIGWLITAFAVMLGAPFWFDVLNKFMVIRATVKPHEKSGEEGSEDRPATPTRVATGTSGSGAGAKPSAPSPFMTRTEVVPDDYVANTWNGDEPNAGVL